MLKHFVFLTILSSFTLATIPSAQSADIYDPHSNFGYPSDISGGLYLKVPFNGGLKRSSNKEARFGQTLTTTLPQKLLYTPTNYRYSFQGSADHQIRFLDLSISPRGIKSFRLNGMSLQNINALYADEEGKKKTKTWLYILGGAALSFGILTVIAHASCNSGDPNSLC